MPLIAEIYMVSAVVGALVLLASAMLGFVGHSHVGHGGGHGAIGHGAGHGGVGHGGAHTGAHSGAHSGAHGAAHGGGHAAGHGAAGHSASAGAHTAGHGAGHGAAHTTGHAGAGHNSHTGGHSGSSQGTEAELPLALATAHVPHPAEQHQEKLIAALTLMNPATFAAFAVWFGACGLISWRLLPVVPVELTLVIAVIGGFVGTRLTLQTMSLMVSRMHSSASFRKDSLIGFAAEVTVSFEAGRTGEISCVARGASCTFSARCLHSGDSFKRGNRVIISDIRDDIAYVEAWPEDVLPLDGTAADDAALDSPQSDRLRQKLD